MRGPTHIAQKDLNITECMDFVVAVNARNSNHHILQQYIPFNCRFCVNMDETPLYNDQRPRTTICNKGQLSVNCRSTRNGDYRCTVILAVALDGTKLMPMIIFKVAGELN